MNPKLQQLARQLAAIWKQLGTNQKVSVAVTSVAVLAGLIALGMWSNQTDYELLFGRLDDEEASRVITALNEAKVPYRAGRNGSAIYVPGNLVYKTRMQLAAKKIPAAKGDGVGFEIFDKPNFGISDFVQRANYVRAIQGELSRTIGQLDGVEVARVQIVLPESRLLLDQKKHPTASVWLKLRQPGSLPPDAVNAVCFLVANSVEGLQPSNVMVMDNRGNLLSENNDPSTVSGLTSGQLATRRKLEEYLSRKAQDMLEVVLGSGQAVVRVSADINYDTLTRTDTKLDPDGQVARQTTINKEKNDSTTANAQGGVPGVSANTATETNNVVATPINKSLVDKNETTTEYEISKTVSNLVQGAGGVKRLSAAVFVAAKTEGTGATRKTVTRTPEELEKLKRIVQGALGIQTDGTRKDEIVLEEMPFNDTQGMELTQKLDQQQKQEFWWELASKLVYPALGLVVLMLFWRSFKQTPMETIPIGIPLSQLSGNGNGHGGNGNSEAMPDWRKPAEPGIVTADVLNQLIRENPGNMTQAIRNWLTRK